MEGTGEDTDGKEYDSITDMWSSELAGADGRQKWYAKATEWWEVQECSLNGVLGGYPETNGPDLRESKRFLGLIRKGPTSPAFDTVLDCGAGIGRVTKDLLLPIFNKVDLVEPCTRLLETARKEISDPRAERFLESNLQDFVPEVGRYDVIWAQWVLLYLPDDDLVEFLVRCRDALKEQGLVCVKENVVLEGNWVVDKEDNSIARTDGQYKAIFSRAGLRVEHELKQTCWPTDLIPVMMYALRPVTADAAVQKKPARATTTDRKSVV